MAEDRQMGRTGMAEGMRDFPSAWKDFRVNADQYLELDDERVLMLTNYTGRGKKSGLDLGRVHKKAALLFHAGRQRDPDRQLLGPQRRSCRPRPRSGGRLPGFVGAIAPRELQRRRSGGCAARGAACLGGPRERDRIGRETGGVQPLLPREEVLGPHVETLP
jgi:hypothetical protein